MSRGAPAPGLRGPGRAPLPPRPWSPAALLRGLLAAGLLAAASGPPAGCAPPPVRRASDALPPAPAPRPPLMEEVLPVSLRGEDELAVSPIRPRARREPLPFTWQGPLGARVLDGWPKQSESVGRPSDGALIDGCYLDEVGPGWVRGGDRGFGTDELVAAVLWAIQRVQEQFPDTTTVYIGDLSADGGGRAPPHASHQSGRDVDVAYYVAGTAGVRSFVRVDAATLDAPRTWAFFEGLLSTGLLKYVFVDYPLQEPLYGEARAVGWTEEALVPVFEYPQRGSRTAIIRHARGHDDHFHVRIACPVGDADCRD